MFRAPRQLPPLGVLLDDLATRDLRQVARALGVGHSTLKRYIKDEQAPRAVMLALFWESRWGLSIIDSDIDRRHQLQAHLVDILQRRVAALQAMVDVLMARGADEAANAPLWAAGCERAERATPDRVSGGQPSQGFTGLGVSPHCSLIHSRSAGT